MVIANYLFLKIKKNHFIYQLYNYLIARYIYRSKLFTFDFFFFVIYILWTVGNCNSEFAFLYVILSYWPVFSRRYLETSSLIFKNFNKIILWIKVIVSSNEHSYLVNIVNIGKFAIGHWGVLIKKIIFFLKKKCPHLNIVIFLSVLDFIEYILRD